MADDFDRVLTAHMHRYPRMQSADYAKLAYQSEFGPEHLMADWQTMTARICSELPEAKPGAGRAEPVGNGLCRFHLDGDWDETDARLLSRLMALTAQTARGTPEGLAEKITRLAGLPVPGMAQYLADWTARGCPPVRHSEEFRRTWSPHYRLLDLTFAVFFPALRTLGRLAEAGDETTTRIAAIDGRCGSGKTTLAALAARLLGCPVVHMDDYYLPFDHRAPDWESSPGGNMDLERVLTEILLPARAHTAAVCRPYSCQTGRYGDAVTVPPSPLLLVEGSYSMHPLLRDHYDLTIFTTCSARERDRRLKAREGERFPRFQALWIPLEEGYFLRDGVQAASTLVLDTTPPVP